MGRNLLLDSINRGLEIRLYRKKAVMLETELLHLQQYAITSSTVTSHKSQLIKIFYVARNLASCELLPCSGLGVDGVMMESSSWGVLLTFLGVDGFFPSRVTVRVLPCGSAVVSAHVLPVFCPFCSLFFLLYVIPFLSDWIFPEVMSFGGFFLNCLGVDSDAPSSVSVVVSHLFWAVVSDRVMPCDDCFVPYPSSFT